MCATEWPPLSTAAGSVTPQGRAGCLPGPILGRHDVRTALCRSRTAAGRCISTRTTGPPMRSPAKAMTWGCGSSSTQTVDSTGNCRLTQREADSCSQSRCLFFLLLEGTGQVAANPTWLNPAFELPGVSTRTEVVAEEEIGAGVVELRMDGVEMVQCAERDRRQDDTDGHGPEAPTACPGAT